MFKQFSGTIDEIHPPAVRRFISRIHCCVEDALLYKRIDETRDTHSVLCFCQFMNSVFEDDEIFPLDGLPVRHIAFYGKVVARLIEAGELPEVAMKKFDAVFSAGFLRGLTACQMPK